MLLSETWETCSTDQSWDRQTEAYTYWRERDHCWWNGRLAKP